MVETGWVGSCNWTGLKLCAAIKRHVVSLAGLQSLLLISCSVTDITYIRTWQGWLYLAVVIDLFARNVVGWSMKPTLSRELALDALMMAVWRRKPDSEVIVHSDQGSQYGSDDWQRFYRANNLAPSMSRRGNCWDNAVAESFFSSLKKERIRKRIYKTRDLARADLRLH